jgi:hypothetical protein
MPRGRSWNREDDQGAPRHSPDWYDQSREATVLIAGDRMFIPCEGGPSRSRLEHFPPRLEIAERDGTYVLVDIGARDAWQYVFVPRRP